MQIVYILYMVLCPLSLSMPLRFTSPIWKRITIFNSTKLTNYYLNKTNTQIITYLMKHKEDLYDS